MSGPQPTGSGSSDYKCPNGYHRDDRTGQCAENCRPGFVAFQGSCIQHCPTGMALNDEKTCIRPTFSRAYFQEEVNALANTTIVAVGSTTNGIGKYALGQYSDIDKDIVFTQPNLESFNLESSGLVVKPYELGTGTASFLIGEQRAQNDPSKTSGPVAAQFLDFIAQSNGTEPNSQLTKPISGTTNVSQTIVNNAKIVEAGGRSIVVDDQVQFDLQTQSLVNRVQNNSVSFQNGSTTSDQPNVLPNSIAKQYLYNQTKTKRMFARADPSSAQSNVIFNAEITEGASSQNVSEVSFRFGDPAVNVSNELELVISGSQPTLVPDSGNFQNPDIDFGIEGTGIAIDQNPPQKEVNLNADEKFEATTAMASRKFGLENALLWNPPSSAPTSVLDPQTANGIPMNAGQISVGPLKDTTGKGPTLNRSFATALQPTANANDVQIEKMDGPPKEINTNISSVYEIVDKIPSQRKTINNALQVNQCVRLQRPFAFDNTGNVITPNTTDATAASVQNVLYLQGRGFDPKNIYGFNFSLQGEPILSQMVECGQMGSPIQYQVDRQSQPVSAVATKTTSWRPGLFAVTGNLAQTPIPKLEAEVIELVDGEKQSGLGDLQYNSTTDSIAMSFVNIASSLHSLASGQISGTSAEDFEQRVLRFAYTGSVQKFVVPSNCVNVHFVLMGAGGSAEQGQGGSGAQVEGDLIPNNNAGWWNVGKPCELAVIVGGGGNSDNNQGRVAFGGGGAGQASGLGQGGGRTAIQSVDTTGSTVLQRDRVVAAGGGGSTGSSLGGNAGHYVFDGTSEFSKAQNGTPAANGGRGAAIVLGTSDTFLAVSKGQPGRGGSAQGLEQNANAQAGAYALGGSSYGFPVATQSLGAGGGGGGYLGGGAACYLGNVDHALDLPAGGGGGCSFAPRHTVRNLQSAAGSYTQGPQVSTLANKLLETAGRVAVGGSANQQSGAPGQAVVILTLRKNMQPALQNTDSRTSLQYSVSGFDPRVNKPFGLINTTATQDSNNAFRATRATFTTAINPTKSSPTVTPQNFLSAVFISNSLLIACEWGPLSDSTNAGLWIGTKSSESARAFTALTNAQSKLFGAVSNVRAIRDVNGFTQPSTSSGTETTLAFLGDGIFIVKIAQDSSGNLVQPSPITVTAATSWNGDPLSEIFKFDDGCYNGQNSGQFLAAGVPSQLSLSMSIGATTLPTFAVGTIAPDMPEMSALQAPFVQGSSTGWLPQTPAQLSRQNAYFGLVQDNTIKYATNGLYTVACGGYLALNTNLQQQTILEGTEYSFALVNQGDTKGGTLPILFSGIQDWSSQEFLDPDSQVGLLRFLNTGLIRNPSTLLVSEDNGQTFNLSLSEYATLNEGFYPSVPSGATPITSPLTNQVALPMDLPHVKSIDKVDSYIVRNFSISPEEWPPANFPANLPRPNQRDSSMQYNVFNEDVIQALSSRFTDVTFFANPSASDPTDGYFLAIGNFVWDLNMCHQLGGQLPLSGLSDPSNPITFPANTLPVNRLSEIAPGTATSTTQLMNNCIWILSANDIRNGANKDSPQQTWKARTLTSKRVDNFQYCVTINALNQPEDTLDDNGDLIPVAQGKSKYVLLTTNVGLYRISYKAIDDAQNQPLFSPVTDPNSVTLYRYWNPKAVVQCEGVANDIICKQKPCNSCVKNTNSVLFSGTPELGNEVTTFCTQQQSFNNKLSTDEDSQGYFNLLNVLNASGVAPTPGPTPTPTPGPTPTPTPGPTPTPPPGGLPNVPPNTTINVQVNSDQGQSLGVAWNVGLGISTSMTFGDVKNNNNMLGLYVYSTEYNASSIIQNFANGATITIDNQIFQHVNLDQSTSLQPLNPQQNADNNVFANLPSEGTIYIGVGQVVDPNATPGSNYFSNAFKLPNGLPQSITIGPPATDTLGEDAANQNAALVGANISLVSEEAAGSGNANSFSVAQGPFSGPDQFNQAFGESLSQSQSMVFQNESVLWSNVMITGAFTANQPEDPSNYLLPNATGIETYRQWNPILQDPKQVDESKFPQVFTWHPFLGLNNSMGVLEGENGTQTLQRAWDPFLRQRFAGLQQSSGLSAGLLPGNSTSVMQFGQIDAGSSDLNGVFCDSLQGGPSSNNILPTQTPLTDANALLSAGSNPITSPFFPVTQIGSENPIEPNQVPYDGGPFIQALGQQNLVPLNSTTDPDGSYLKGFFDAQPQVNPLNRNSQPFPFATPVTQGDFVTFAKDQNNALHFYKGFLQLDLTDFFSPNPKGPNLQNSLGLLSADSINELYAQYLPLLACAQSNTYASVTQDNAAFYSMHLPMVVNNFFRPRNWVFVWPEVILSNFSGTFLGGNQLNDQPCQATNQNVIFQAQTEFMAPDPFEIFQNGLTGPSQLNQQASQSSKSQFGSQFPYVLGLTQLSYGLLNQNQASFQIQQPKAAGPFRLNNSNVNENTTNLVLVNASGPVGPNLPPGSWDLGNAVTYATSTNQGSPLQPLVFPDENQNGGATTPNTANTPITWLAEDAKWTPNSQSPIQANSHAVFFSTGRTVNTTNNPPSTNAYKNAIFQCQMDILINCTLLANMVAQNEIFDFSQMSPTDSPTDQSWLIPLINPQFYNNSGSIFNPFTLPTLNGQSQSGPTQGVFVVNTLQETAPPIPLGAIWEAALNLQSGQPQVNGINMWQNDAPQFNYVLLTAPAAPASIPAWNQLGPLGDGTTQQEPGNYVSQQNTIYVCIAQNIYPTKPTDTEYWTPTSVPPGKLSTILQLFSQIDPKYSQGNYNQFPDAVWLNATQTTTIPIGQGFNSTNNQQVLPPSNGVNPNSNGFSTIPLLSFDQKTTATVAVTTCLNFIRLSQTLNLPMGYQSPTVNVPRPIRNVSTLPVVPSNLIQGVFPLGMNVASVVSTVTNQAASQNNENVDWPVGNSFNLTTSLGLSSSTVLCSQVMMGNLVLFGNSDGPGTNIDCNWGFVTNVTTNGTFDPFPNGTIKSAIQIADMAPQGSPYVGFPNPNSLTSNSQLYPQHGSGWVGANSGPFVGCGDWFGLQNFKSQFSSQFDNTNGGNFWSFIDQQTLADNNDPNTIFQNWYTFVTMFQTGYGINSVNTFRTGATATWSLQQQTLPSSVALSQTPLGNNAQQFSWVGPDGQSILMLTTLQHILSYKATPVGSGTPYSGSFTFGASNGSTPLGPLLGNNTGFEVVQSGTGNPISFTLVSQSGPIYINPTTVANQFLKTQYNGIQLNVPLDPNQTYTFSVSVNQQNKGTLYTGQQAVVSNTTNVPAQATPTPTPTATATATPTPTPTATATPTPTPLTQPSALLSLFQPNQDSFQYQNFSQTKVFFQAANVNSFAMLNQSSVTQLSPINILTGGSTQNLVPLYTQGSSNPFLSNQGVWPDQVVAPAKTASYSCSPVSVCVPSDRNPGILTNRTLVPQGSITTQIEQQDSIPSATPVGASILNAIQQDPNRIVNDGQIQYEGTIQKSIVPTANLWKVIAKDNARPRANEIVVEANRQAIAVGVEIVGRNIKPNTFVTGYRTDASIPNGAYRNALYLTLSQKIPSIQPGQIVFTSNPSVLSNFSQQFSEVGPVDPEETNPRKTYEFYKTLGTNQVFQATLSYVNPYIAQPVQSLAKLSAIDSTLGPPGQFPATSWLNYVDGSTRTYMNSFHKNPYFNAWTFAYLFNGLYGTEMIGPRGSSNTVPWTQQQTRGTGIVPMTYIVPGSNLRGQPGNNSLALAVSNVKNGQTIYGANMNKWTLDISEWTHTSSQAQNWNTKVLQAMGSLVHPNLLRVAVPQMLHTFDNQNASREPSLDQTALPNHFLALQAKTGSPGKAFGLVEGPSALRMPQTNYDDLVPQNANYVSQHTGLLASNNANFTKPVVISETAAQGSRSNPMIFMTNPMKDIYHNGFNAGFNPVGQGVQHDWPASLLYGDFHLGDGDPSTNNSNNGLDSKYNRTSVPPTSQRPQLGIAAVQQHEDKVYLKLDFQGKPGIFLNFPNWAMYVPPAQSSHFNADPSKVRTQGPSALPEQQQETPLQNADPEQTLQTRTIKTADNSGFGSSVGTFKGGQVLTNRNQNDQNPPVFGSQEQPDITRPPIFGWIMTQFNSDHYSEQSYQSQFSANPNTSPSNPTQQTPLSAFDIVPPGLPLNNAGSPTPMKTLNKTAGPQPVNSTSVYAGTASKWALLSNIWPQNIVSTACAKGSAQVPTDPSQQSPSFSLFQLSNQQAPTTSTVAFNDQEFPASSSRSQRFDGGSILSQDPTKGPSRADPKNLSATTGVSIWIPADRGDTICFSQNLLRPLTTVERPSVDGSPYLPGGQTITSWPGVTDTACLYSWDPANAHAQGIQNQVPSFLPDVPMLNQPFAEINGGQPGLPRRGQGGYGAQGTNLQDDPQIICCYISDGPDFQKVSDDSPGGNIQSTTINASNASSQPTTTSTSAGMNIYQLQPQRAYNLDVIQDTSLAKFPAPYNSQSPSIVPLYCEPSGSSFLEQSIPDFSGLGLSLVARDPLQSRWTWQDDVIVPSQDPQSESWTNGNKRNWLKLANAPNQSSQSPFAKYAQLFFPLWSYTELNNEVSYLGPTGPEQTESIKIAQTDPKGSSQTYWVGNPNPGTKNAAGLINFWNKYNPQLPTIPGGLSALPLRRFDVSLTDSGFSNNGIAPTCTGTNAFLFSKNLVLVGTSIGTIRLFDIKNNTSLATTSFSAFHKIVKGRVTQVVVREIYAIVWFQRRWFVATDGGLFYTPVAPTNSFLRGQTERVLQTFDANNIKFVQLPPQTQNNLEGYGASGNPPCTLLKKIRNGKKSFLVVAYPDYAQGFFNVVPNATGANDPNYNQHKNVFPELKSLGPSALARPLNGGNTFDPGNPKYNGDTTSQLFQVQTRRAATGLNEFAVITKFTGLPTSGSNWVLGKVIINGTPTTGSINVPRMINSNLTDIVLANQNTVLQSGIQVPFARSQNQGNPSSPPDVFFFSQAIGSVAGLLSQKTEILAPTPLENSQLLYLTEDGRSGIRNLTTPVGGDEVDIYGDQTIQISQIVAVSASVPNEIRLDKRPTVSNELAKFFGANGILQQNINNAGYAYSTVTDFTNADPHAQDSGQGLIARFIDMDNSKPLSLVQLTAAPQQTRIGIAPNSLGIAIQSPPIVLNDVIEGLGQFLTLSNVASITTSPQMQAFWGLSGERQVQQGTINPQAPGGTFLGPYAANGKAAQPLRVIAQQEAEFWFFGVDEPAWYNSAILQWNPTQKPSFQPKSQQADSAFDRKATQIANDQDTPPLFERLFEKLLVQKMNLIEANESIGDFAYADIKGGILTWTQSGAQSISPIQMSTPTSGISTAGVVLSVQSPDVSPISTQTSTSYMRPDFGLPSIGSNAILAQNPYSNEFFAAGIGLGVDDTLYLADYATVYPNVTPPNLELDAVVLYKRRNQRFMIASNPGILGSVFAENNFGGVPIAASDLLPSTLNWVQVVQQLPYKDVNATNLTPITFLSQQFSGATVSNPNPGPCKVNCIEFSPTSTAIAGFFTTSNPVLGTSQPTQATALWQRNNGSETWQNSNLLIRGEVTAMVFVGYGWQIATWTPASDALNQNFSSLQFASANFSLVGLVETWSADQRSMRINSLAFAKKPPKAPCDRAKGFEPNPLNPRTCLKVCPPQQEAVGEQCALKCPTELGYRTTPIANQCVPPQYQPKQVAGYNANTKPSQTSQDGGKPNDTLVPPVNNVPQVTPLLIATSITLLLVASFMYVQYMWNHPN